MTTLRTSAPIIAVIIGREPTHRYSVHRGYIDAVAAAGGLPLVLPAIAGGGAHDRMMEVIEQADGILLTGGGDVDPTRYDRTVAPEVYDVDPVRDVLEIDAFHAARARGMRVLGICRGIQIMAVASGGSLHQHLPDAGFDHHWEESRQYEPVHEVLADPGTAAEVALAGTVKVNSIHHQAVREPGNDLRATAWSDDGVIEAVEGEAALGIQWHPERLLDLDARHLAPFRWLVEEQVA
ncbi:MAG TPA: gamma-glutamyl-gamma-aminobutyrate hydrolase family protein [Acidimicrobiia bacterium]|jgi:putative glutamine amidotransferase|nr:gamma-glutamyl-gamma-aminobutyrate hydrolase family protein [Acidimicrobiia bacterium]